MVSDRNHIPMLAATLRAGALAATKQAGDEAVKRIERGFDTGQDALGRSWQELSPETIRQKGHGQILVREGDLSESFNVKVDVRKGVVRIYTDDPKAGIHEFGAPESNIPSRAMLRPAASWIEQDGITGIVAPGIEKHIRRFEF